MRLRALAFFAAAAAFAAACSPPSYVSYKSVSGDFTVSVPWGWDVIAEAQYDAFSKVTFIGPFDKDFYLGAPSMNIRWYKPLRPHGLLGGETEMYTGSADFIKQTLDDLYGKDAIVYGPSSLPLDQRPTVDRRDIPTITLKTSGLEAKYFGVLSPTPASSNATIGVMVDKDGRRINQRYHEYAVVPIEVDGREVGFYVLNYPATVGGHDKGMEQFKHLIGSFHPYTAGPGGPKITIRGPQTAKPL